MRALRIVQQDKNPVLELYRNVANQQQFIRKISNIWQLKYLKKKMAFLRK